jgi:hypothetical protein
MSSFNMVAERPLPFAQDAEPGVYLADPSRRLKAFLFEEAVYVVAFVVIAVFAGVYVSLAVTSVLWLALQVNAIRQQQTQPLTHPARDAPILAAPEQAMVHHDGVGLGLNGRFDQGAAGRHAADQQSHWAIAFDLQAIGAIVAEFFRLQQGIKSLA